MSEKEKPLTAGVSDLDVDELKRIVARLEDQDNLCTRDVAFHVQQRVRLYGIDPEYTENVAWMQDGEEIDPDLWERLDEAESNGETGIGVGDDECYVLAEIERVGFVDRWETVQVFFTSEGAERYIKTNWHHLTDPRICGKSFHRNYEMMTVRKNLPRLLSMLHPPTDAAVREAVEESAKKAWEECHALSSELSKANQDRDRWRECAVYLDYRGADYCVAIHKELDGLQKDNAEHRAQMSCLLKEWQARATRAEAELAKVREVSALLVGEEIQRAQKAEAELAECKHELSSLRNTLDDLVTIQRERADKAEDERDEARAKCERLEWLAEVMSMKMHRLRKPGEWNDPKDGVCKTLEQTRKAWARRSDSNGELCVTLQAALAECGEGE